MKNAKISCMDCELLISKSCDGECSEEELAGMREHLRGCSVCQRTLEEYRGICSLMAARLAAPACPAPPSMSLGFLTLKLKRAISGLRLGRYALRAAMAALCVVFFISGHIVGSAQGKLKTIEKVSPAVVATPSMWIAERPSDSSELNGTAVEQPFTESIMRYRSAVGAELRRGDVDWMRVRELVEAMGELRTDLELLTLHLAYLDIYTGNSPYEVAEHWEKIVGKALLR